MWWLLVALLGLCMAAPVSVVVPANGRACFYQQASSSGSKASLSFAVLSGGSFDIDATIKRPDKSIIESYSKSTGDEAVFTTTLTGEYELCFYNEMSTFADKKIEFDFDLDASYLRAELPHNIHQESAQGIERYINNLEVQISELARSLQYYKIRNLRNQATVASTHDRVWWFCLIELALVVGMSFLNVTIVQMFFKGARKTLV